MHLHLSAFLNKEVASYKVSLKDLYTSFCPSSKTNNTPSTVIVMDAIRKKVIKQNLAL